MRLRKKPWASKLINENKDLIFIDPINLEQQWSDIFDNGNPIFLEVGAGKGKFIMEMAIKYPNNNYIALENQESAIAMILKKQMNLQLSNLRLILGNAINIDNYFKRQEIEGIFLNFPDPWPKKRHTKRRLTYSAFLQKYKFVLKKDKQVIFKTDNQRLFEFSLVSMNNFNMIFDDVSLDLHSRKNIENIETEYEKKFSDKGFPICQIKAHFIN